MPRYQTRITTPLAPAEAFALLSRFDRAAEWDPGIEAGSMLTPEPVGRGSRFALQARFAGRSLPLEYEIVDLVADARVVLRAENPYVVSIDTITFDARGTGTEISYDARLEPKGPARLATPLFAFAFHRIGARAAAGLDRHLNAARSA
jgi:hypothetical protein